MKHFLTALALSGTLFASGGVLAQDTGISVENGDRIARIGGCHDCHTPGFAEANGELDPAQALVGSPVGYQGPWGTTYASNLRIVAAGMGEEEFADYLRNLQAMPPMPWFNLHYFTDNELRSLHQYIVSLGEVGEPAPAYVPPGEAPQTPFIVFAPPQMP
ncbi:cytochrome C [Arsenicitalea aurantiaca]|uniref:Cytochrome C n=1 Tax=Arsenicitalea aurantiaca TaxID=1783274 RepID=A0A433XG23_9HYPH|nr:c-type cytochrome [Arsenicitalea aurantiaca]RUT33016.1 cytochrome C [Arsenicitalea aurantiaca]